MWKKCGVLPVRENHVKTVHAWDATGISWRMGIFFGNARVSCRK